MNANQAPLAPNSKKAGESYLCELRLLLEELCCDLCRFELAAKRGAAPEMIDIDREYYLGTPKAYADIRVAPPGGAPYFVEVKCGYSNEVLVQHLTRKYGARTPQSQDAAKVVLVLDLADRPGWEELLEALRSALWPGLELEVWHEQHLSGLLKDYFGVEVRDLNAADLLEVRSAIDRAKGFCAFGGPSLAEYDHDPLKARLLWHLGFWRLRQLREPRQATPQELVPTGSYADVVVLIADLCSFSSYVRDTPDADIIRENLTAFYSKARYEILNHGGMLYQFAGDQAVGLFGVPDRQAGYLGAALDTARGLIDIGSSVSHHWQRRIDRVQERSGVHVGMATGDLQIVPLRPFSRSNLGAVGDCINVAARLMDVAGPGEIVVSNSLYQEFDGRLRQGFTEFEPVVARNVGRLKAWITRGGVALTPGEI